MSESTISKHYRLEVRLGRMGWRAHARGPNGIEWTSPLPHSTREIALEEGRDTLRAAGLEAWDEWMDGITDNHFDPRVASKLKVDAAAEAKAAGIQPADDVALTEATQKLRELEARRMKAFEDARDGKLQQRPDVGLTADGGPPNPAEEKPETPLKQQRARRGKVAEE